jgi:glycosyltransferase involved in cell wall biosynthesis
MKTKNNISNIFIVIPAYNENKNIGKTLSNLKKEKLPVIVVDDGSKDPIFTDIKGCKHVQIVRHKVNLGKGAAMKTGCERAFGQGADAVIFMDADGQHVARDIPKFTEALKKGYDIVLGSRNTGYGIPLVRFLGNKFGAVMISLMFGIYVSDLLCGYRAITKKAYEKIKWESARYGVETEMVIRTAKEDLKYCEVPVSTVYLDAVKGVTLLDAINIFFDVIRWRFTL